MSQIALTLDAAPAAPIVPEAIRSALEDGAVVALSVSGGKDSQAMALAVLALLRAEELPNRVVAVHADLGRAEWFDTPAQVEAQAAGWGVHLEVVRRTNGDLLDRIRERAETVGHDRPFWPSAASRYCTSDLKRGPIDRYLRTLGPLVISVEGVRAQESHARAKKPCWEPRNQITNSRRTALTWRPIHHWTEAQVWTSLGSSLDDLERRRALHRLGMEAEAMEGWASHPAYVRGNERLSCSICILANRADMENGARHNPAYLQALVELEEEYGWTFTSTTSVVELAKAVARDEARVA